MTAGSPDLRSRSYVIDFWGLGYDTANRIRLAPQLERVGYLIHELRIVDDHRARIARFGTGVFQSLTGGRFVTLGRSDPSRLLFEAGVLTLCT